MMPRAGGLNIGVHQIKGVMKNNALLLFNLISPQQPVNHQSTIVNRRLTRLIELKL